MTNSARAHKTISSTENIDANASSTTASLDINGNDAVGLFVSAVSGTNTTHIITLQESVDDSTFFDSSLFVNQLGSVEGTVTTEFVRAKVTTVEGAASTVTVSISSK
ncbi:MAG: hypothetical protein V3U84_11525 [Thiotrichaceae bacterium]